MESEWWLFLVSGIGVEAVFGQCNRSQKVGVEAFLVSGVGIGQNDFFTDFDRRLNFSLK